MKKPKFDIDFAVVKQLVLEIIGYRLFIKEQGLIDDAELFIKDFMGIVANEDDLDGLLQEALDAIKIANMN